jgi:hypothetical protein
MAARKPSAAEAVGSVHLHQATSTGVDLDQVPPRAGEPLPGGRGERDVVIERGHAKERSAGQDR